MIGSHRRDESRSQVRRRKRDTRATSLRRGGWSSAGGTKDRSFSHDGRGVASTSLLGHLLAFENPNSGSAGIGRFCLWPRGIDKQVLEELEQQAKIGGVRIERLATTENLGALRREAVEEASRLGMADECLADLKTIVSEACANVVRYAYGEDGDGPVEVELIPDERDLTIIVRDRGTGICPKPEADIPSLRMGLPLIGALSSCFRLTSKLDVGTVLEARLPLRA
jgi:anti-sigma regulatory factor (Ser/Thr protein kinase)